VIPALPVLRRAYPRSACSEAGLSTAGVSPRNIALVASRAAQLRPERDA